MVNKNCMIPLQNEKSYGTKIDGTFMVQFLPSLAVSFRLVKNLRFLFFGIFCVINIICVPAQSLSKDDFFGTWVKLYDGKGIGMNYTISDDSLVGVSEDGDSFIVEITNWTEITNSDNNVVDYPNGYQITGIIIDMIGRWWINKGDSYTWTWYIKIDKDSILLEEIIWKKQ